MWHAASCDNRLDPTFPQQAAVLVEVVAAVGEQLPRPVTRSTSASPDVRYRIEQGQQLGDIVPVAAGEPDSHRGAVGISDHVVLRARPGTVDRARAGFGPPRRACRCEPSITARDQSSFPAWCSSVSNTWWSRSHTPASFQSRSRRQHVIPEPNPSSCGSHSHWIPVCNTNRIPCRHRRSSNGRRPALRDLRSRTGNRGSNRPHKSSVTTHGGRFPFPMTYPTSHHRPRHGHTEAFC